MNLMSILVETSLKRIGISVANPQLNWSSCYRECGFAFDLSVVNIDKSCELAEEIIKSGQVTFVRTNIYPMGEPPLVKEWFKR
jgi:hypothetical protein